MNKHEWLSLNNTRRRLMFLNVHIVVRQHDNYIQLHLELASDLIRNVVPVSQDSRPV